MIYSVRIPGTPAFKRNGCVYTKQSEIAFHDRIRVECDSDEFFGGSASRSYQSRILVAPTWGTLLRIAKSQQKKTQDFHHSFLEGASIVRREVDKDGVSYGVVNLHLGS